MEIVVIANPTAGFRQPAWHTPVRDVLSRLGDVRIVEPASAAGSTLAAREAEAAGASFIIAAGGDGTVHRVINGMTPGRTAFGILPVGTANDLARHIGVPGSAIDAARAMTEGAERAIDTVRVIPEDGPHRELGVRIHTVGGFQLIADAAMRADRMKRRAPWIGPAVYKIAAAISIALHGGDPSPGIFIANQPTLGGNLKLPCDSVVDDGRFELATLHGRGRLSLARTLAAMSAGKPLPPGAMTSRSASEATLEFERPVEWFGDGEGFGHARRFHLRIEPAGVRVRGVRD
jgi:diacylglycerol kinase (ATP)